MPVKVRCPVCGVVTYKPDLDSILRQIENLWKPWREYLTVEQKKKIEEYNNKARLEVILEEKGEIKMFCPICIFTAMETT